jgi:hypothetical protein
MNRPLRRLLPQKIWTCERVNQCEVPVFINNRNRVSTTKSLVNWLLDADTQRITIIDNNSSYAPLLDYYEALPSGVSVMKLKQNLGPTAFWKLGLNKHEHKPFVMTDSDMMPDDLCPKDLIGTLNETLCSRPESIKCGPGLRIDDIPNVAESERLNGLNIEEQKKFWERRYSHNAFFAYVDTTFALYSAHCQWLGQMPRNLRMDFPYVFRHIPWYTVESSMSEEERYYRSHVISGPIENHPWSHAHLP